MKVNVKRGGVIVLTSAGDVAAQDALKLPMDGLRNPIRTTIFLSLAVFAVGLLPLEGQLQSLFIPSFQVSDAADFGLALVNPTLTLAEVTLTARSYDGFVIQHDGVTNPVTLTLPASAQIALRAQEIFGSGISGQSGWVELSASTSAVKGFFLVFNSGLSFLDGAPLTTTPASRLVFPKVAANPSSPTRLTLINTAPQPIQGTVSLYENSGRLAATGSIALSPFSAFLGTIDELVPVETTFEGYAVVDSSQSLFGARESLVGVETYRNRSDIALVRAFPESAKLRTGYVAHLATRGGYSTNLTLINFTDQRQVLEITAESLEVSRAMGTRSVTVQRVLPPRTRLEEQVDHMFNLTGDQLITGYIRFETLTDTPGINCFLDFGTADGSALSAVEAQGDGYSDLFFSHLAEGGAYWTGVALLNPNSEPSAVTLDSFDNTGRRSGSTILNLNPGARKAGLLSDFFAPQAINQIGGYVHLTATRPVYALEFFGSRDSSFLVNVTGQGVRLTTQMSERFVDAFRGANVISEDGSASLLIPPFALTSNTSISVTPLNINSFPRPAPNQRPVGGVRARPSGMAFGIPVRLTFPLNVQVQPHTQIPLLILNTQTQQYEQTEFVGVVDDSGRTASVEVTNLGTFVVALPDIELLTVSAVSPSQGLPGAEVTLIGDGFSTNASDNSVTFAGRSNTPVIATVTAATATSLRVIVPSGAVTGLVIVRTGTQTSAGVVFTVPANPIPAGIYLTPSSASDRTKSISIEISGTGFKADSAVSYDGAVIPGNFIDSTLIVTTLSSPQLKLGLHRIQVANLPPGGGTSKVVEFIVSKSQPENQAPLVSAGPDQTVILPASASLSGTVFDDGLPAGKALTPSWSTVSGPGGVTFSSPNSSSTAASFSAVGSYVLRLTASDGELSAAANLVVRVSTAPETGQVFYVSTSGDDSNPGTPSAPWRTIQKAADTVVAGATVNVNAGTYEEHVQIKNSGDAGSPITFQAHGSVIMRGFTINANYTRVLGFEITNSLTDPVNTPGILLEGAFNEILNNYVHDLFAEGIWIYGGPNRDSSSTRSNIISANRIVRASMAGIMVEGRTNLIEGNDISHSIQYQPGAAPRPGPDADGLRFFGTGHTIRRNWIHDILHEEFGNRDPHVDCFQTWGPATKVLFERNFCDNPNDQEQGWMIESLEGVVTDLTMCNNIVKAFRLLNVFNAPGMTIVNNSFKSELFYTGASGYGIELHNSPNSRVQNNLFYDVGRHEYPYVVQSPNSESVISYNAVYMSDGQAPAASPMPNDLWQIDPQIVNVGLNDFHLRPTSPLIDAATTLAVVPDDYDGNARPQGLRFDIGAFEFPKR